MRCLSRTILLGILAVVVSFLSYYFYIKGKLYKAAEGAINDAEPDEDPENEKICAQKLQKVAKCHPS